MWIVGTITFFTILSVAIGQNVVVDSIKKLFRENGEIVQLDYFSDSPDLPTTFNFIVVGSGPAGSAIASRLSENKEWNVLLIDKGPEANTYNDIPFLNVYTLQSPFANSYSVEKNPNYCSGIQNEQCQWPDGHGLGGASLINGMMASRGYPSDYDRWADDGNNGWSYNDLLYYLKKLENMTIPLDESDFEFHNDSGPVNIEYSFQSSLGEKFLEAGEELGFDVIDDCNNPNKKLGFCINQGTLLNGKRQSAAAAYLHPIANERKNLYVLKRAEVTKLIMEGSKRRVIGVEYIRYGTKEAVYANKEVIVSGGGFGSPKLLMLSGIGPQEHLEELNIPVLADLPVGQNLLEHYGVPVTFLIDSNESFPLPKIMEMAPDAFKQWLSGDKGIFSNMGLEALGYLKSTHSEENPDIELIFLPVQIAADGGIFAQEYLRISEEVYNKTWSQYNFEEGFLITIMPMYPLSTGMVKLRSKDPKDPPLIYANFFNNSRDMEIIIEGVRAAQSVANTAIFKEIGAKLNPTPVWGCESHPFDSDEYWDCVIRRIPIQYHHQGGTCRMGPNGVVDEQLKVYGIERLRVANTSIMPYLPAKHSMITAYMIGEKAADLIKQDHTKS